MENQQAKLVNALVDMFRQYDAVHAIILGGSMVECPEDVDEWSDVDLKLIIEDGSEEVFLDVQSWTELIGQLVGVEKFHSNESTSIRICLENYQRIDLVLIPFSIFTGSISTSSKVLWKRDTIIVTTADDAGEKALVSFELNSSDVLQKVNALWFQVAVAFAKVARNDYLIAYHLTLKVMQGVLELQMMRRDAVLGTNIHREAGWGNALISQFPAVNMSNPQQGILQTISFTCEILDLLAEEMLADYEPRFPMLEPSIQKAKEHIYV